MTELTDYIDDARFQDLFVEGLGWDRPPQGGRTITVTGEDGTYEAREVATVRGISVWACPTVPDGRTQREVDRAVKKQSTERLLIFHDGMRQQWKWPQTSDSTGSGTARLVTHEHLVGRDNPALIQRLHLVELTLDEDPSVVEVHRRLRKAFDAEKVTKDFYDQFSKELDDLCGAIEGMEVSDEDEQPEVRWYASLLMNRLMFIYFMQRKGFLDNDRQYLQNRLARIQSLSEPHNFYEFYKDFLIPLFHQGLGAAEGDRRFDDPEIAALIGDIPYVNGGIFSVHPLEAANDISVPDSAFADVFDFFDDWRWHLDERPTGDPNEINPDVLGYIFEQFVNNKQQGAYYTKEDVTGYMVDNALVPVFLDRLEAVTGINPWKTLSAQPDRYIWVSLRHGVEQSLPAAVEAEKDAWPRPAWDDTKPGEDLALPGESWWEVIDRRRYVDELRRRISAGKIDSPDDAVTANIDLELLAVDCLDAIDNPDDVTAAWRILTNLKIIDPTCGSGAFLFAALNVLHSLYGAVLDAAEVHAKTKPTSDLADLLDQVSKHASRDYYMLKHATLNNIYGVDLMPEAVEIARLRLFLKLVAQIDKRDNLEPLPDLEFNLRPGNILVGALDEDSIRDTADLTNLEDIDDLIAQAANASKTYREFAEAQEVGDEGTVQRTRDELRQVSGEVRGVLDSWWYQANAPQQDIQQYLDDHQPFHWFIEFPEVFDSGGFDVVVGNPPYVSQKHVPYNYDGFATDDAPDIYAPCTERAATICRKDGRMAFIVMHSLQFSGSFTSLRAYLRRRFGAVHAATFSRRPSTLFTGAGVRSTIFIGSGNGSKELANIYTTDTRRWLPQYRPHLMPSLRYTDATQLVPKPSSEWPRTGDAAVRDLLVALDSTPSSLAEVVTRGGSHKLGYKKTALYYLSVYVDEPPAYDSDRNPIEQPQSGTLAFSSEDDRDIASALLAGRLELVWWASVGDDFHVTKTVLVSFPLAPSRFDDDLRSALIEVAETLREQVSSAPLYTLYAKKWLGNYDFTRLRHITDQADELVLKAFNLEEHRETVRRVDARLQKSSGDAGNSIRTWPPPE